MEKERTGTNVSQHRRARRRKRQRPTSQAANIGKMEGKNKANKSAPNKGMDQGAEGKNKGPRMDKASQSKKATDSVKIAIKKNGGSVHAETDHMKKKRNKLPAIIVIILIAVLFALMLLLKGCNGDIRKVHLDMPEFEKSTGFDSLGNEKATKNGINLAVIPDFTVTKDNQSFVIPYPENEYDAEFYFVDKESGEERYRTKRIKPGSVVKIPAYSFCEDGEHTYRVEVGVFDGESFEEVPSAVALEMNITKK